VTGVRRRVVDELADRVRAAAAVPALTGNVDPERFPAGMAVLTVAQTDDRLRHLQDHADDLDWLAERLDDPSAAVLHDKLAFHVLGRAHARIGPTRAEVDALLATADAELIAQRDVTAIPFAGSDHSHVFDLRALGLPITLESYTLGVQGTFQLQQYRAPGHPEAWPRPGDVAVDAGGCFGETALWLAHAIGPSGRVLTLEFGAANLSILRGNLRRNPELAPRIAAVERALWSDSDARLRIDMAGPASAITEQTAASADEPGAMTISLDDLVTRHQLQTLGFVKLDIEGAEPAAVQGAHDTLARHRPRLAIAVYHDIDHLWGIPQLLDAENLGYRFALGHFTMHDEETVLYAWTEPA
jgi:FkbM family methyltransferase